MLGVTHVLRSCVASVDSRNDYDMQVPSDTDPSLPFRKIAHT